MKKFIKVVAVVSMAYAGVKLVTNFPKVTTMSEVNKTIVNIGKHVVITFEKV